MRSYREGAALSKDFYNVIIVGAGPAGIFSALHLAEHGMDRVLILDQGKDIHERRRSGGMNILCGWGGAGAYSDGKLTFSREVGGFLSEFIADEDLNRLFEEVDRVYLNNGASPKLYGTSTEAMNELETDAKRAGMEFIPARIRHMGTENCAKILKRIREWLRDKVEVRTSTRVEHILVEDSRVKGVQLTSGEQLAGHAVIVAPGRSGARWILEEARRLKLGSTPNPVDIGVRVEAPAAVLTRLTDVAYESKLIYYSHTFDDRVRTFCMNPFGEVVTEEINGLITVNGHSYAHRPTENTNFALLVSSSFTEPFDDPIGYGHRIAQLANLLGKGVIIQRLGDLMAGRRTTQQRLARCITRPTLAKATPGDLSFVLPYRHLKDIMEMLQALDTLTPGIFSRHTLIYGVEVKFYSNRIQLDSSLKSAVENLFIIGDGAGITRGLLQASASGLLAGRAVVECLRT
jgi:uncharacterized FAD-dependent dehydrogenase